MKIKILGLYSKILPFFLVLLGFQSCEEINPEAEYGTPSARYKVKGTVVSENNQKPIPKIEVVLTETYNGEENTYATNRVLTDMEGKFEVELLTFPDEKKTFNLKLKDVDGEENGNFDAKTEQIEFVKPNFTGGQKWYRGETLKKVDAVKLKPSNKTE